MVAFRIEAPGESYSCGVYLGKYKSKPDEEKK